MKNKKFMILTKNETETFKAGYEAAKDLHSGDIVLLHGGLGAGKTVFVKGAAKQKNALQDVTSPTFTIINEYFGDEVIYHMDLYRIEHFEELFNIGFEEYLYSDGIVFIEWPDIAMPIIEKLDHKIISINKIDEKVREITFCDISRGGER